MVSVDDDGNFSLNVPLVSSCVIRINGIEWFDEDRVRLSYWTIEFELIGLDIIKFIILCPCICDTERIEYNKLGTIKIFLFFI
jgi:hypothetical protein